MPTKTTRPRRGDSRSDPAAVRLDDPATDVETEAEAARAAPSGAAVEPLEDPLLLAGAETGSVVGDLDHDRPSRFQAEISICDASGVYWIAFSRRFTITNLNNTASARTSGSSADR